METTLDMAEVLEGQGIRATPGNHPCPECGSSTGLIKDRLKKRKKWIKKQKFTNVDDL